MTPTIPTLYKRLSKKDQRGHQQTKKNQLTNERRLSLTATLLQIWQITFSNQSSHVRLTNNCALDSNDLYWSQSLVSTNDLFKTTLA